MFKQFSPINAVLLAGVCLMLIAFLLIMPLLHLTPTHQTYLMVLVVGSILYAFLSNRAAERWGWLRLAPIIQPINVLIVTLGFAILYKDVPLVWTFYFLIPLSAALVTSVRWAYLDGILSAIGYLSIVNLNGGLNENAGAHLMVASVLITFALFGGMLASVVRQQEQTLREKIEALQTLTAAQQQLIEENKRRAVEMTTLNQIGYAVSNLQALENVFQLIYEQIRHTVPLDAFFICFQDQTTGQVSFPILFDGGKRYYQNPDTLPDSSPLAQTLATGIPRLINRTPTEIANTPLIFRAGDTSRPSASMIYVPLQIKDHIIGAISVQSYQLNAYDHHHLDLVTGIAQQAAIAIENARLYDTARQRAAELEAVRQASLSLTSSLDPATVLQTVAENIMRLNPDAYDTHIYLYDDHHLTFGTSLWADGRRNEEWSTPREDGLTYTVARQGKPIVIPDMRTHPLFVHVSPSFEGAIVGLPLKAGDRVVGVMNIAYRKPRQFTNDELSVLQLIGDQAAIAIVNARLHQAIQESEQRYRSLVENLPIGVYRVTPGPHGKIVMANPTLLKMFGYASLEEMQKHTVADFYMNPSERKVFSDRVSREGSVTNLEQHLKRKDGSSIWVSVNAQTVYQDSQPVYFDCTSIDITARKSEELARVQAEQALQRRTKELEGLLQTSNSISAHLDLEKVLTVIAEQARDLLHATEATLFLFDEAMNLLRPIVALGEYTAERLALTLRPGEGVAGWVAQQRQPANIHHTIQDPRVKHVPGTPEEDESILAVPLIHSEQLVGVILLNRIPATGFTQNELDLLLGMAAQASAAIMNARLFEETRRSALEQRIVSEITGALNSTLDVAQAFPIVVKGLRTLVDCERISLALVDGQQQYFTLQFQDQPHAELPPGTRMPLSTTAAADDVLAGRVHLTPDLGTEINHLAEKILYDAGYRSRVCLPLTIGERAIGSLNLLSRRADAYRTSQLPALLQIANALAIAWENMHLFQIELTRRQELTALYELSRQLADTTSFDTIADIVLRYAVQTIHVTFARLLLLQDGAFVVHAVHPIRDLDQNLTIGQRLPTAASLFCQFALDQNEPTVIGHDDPRLNPVERDSLFLHLAETICLVPLRTGKTNLGLLVLGEERGKDREPFTADKVRLAHSIGDQAASALHRAQLFGELENAYLQTVLALANAVDAKDSDTNVHSQRLAEQALAIGKALGLSPRELEDLHYGAILHDIGKIGVPDAILKKPGPLNNPEWERMYQHPIIGAQILEPLPRLAGAAAIVRHHHERYDGTGYPDGLAGDAIPIGARILTVVDSFGAIIDKRIYKEGHSVEFAAQELRRCAGTQFDPQIVELFLRLILGLPN